jgi:ribosomal protein S18 acetylase RimI-like enzyme
MAYHIRPGRLEDVAGIKPWTSDTFTWGDYVPERLSTWLDDLDSMVLVAADESDLPVAVVHTSMRSPTEGWIEGARVHPAHRRMGLGKALNDAGVEWARSRGARVMRLATEEGNLAARSQVESLHYREVSTWLYAELAVDPTHRAAEQFRLRPAPGSDADAAWLFWAASDLARAGRELIAIGWQWRTARPGDVTGAGELFVSPAGWVSVTQVQPDWLVARWMATTPDDLLPLLDGLLDLAAERRVATIDLKLPDVGWTDEGLRRAGGEVDRVLIYAKAI